MRLGNLAWNILNFILLLGVMIVLAWPLIGPTMSKNKFKTNRKSFVEYYFDILVDKQIDQRELCKYIEHATSRDVFVDEDLECPDQRTARFDIYGTRVTPSDLERCE